MAKRTNSLSQCQSRNGKNGANDGKERGDNSSGDDEGSTQTSATPSLSPQSLSLENDELVQTPSGHGERRTKWHSPGQKKKTFRASSRKASMSWLPEGFNVDSQKDFNFGNPANVVEPNHVDEDENAVSNAGRLDDDSIDGTEAPKPSDEGFLKHLAEIGIDEFISLENDDQSLGELSDVTTGNGSYIMDLARQKEVREKRLKEDILEEAFDLYRNINNPDQQGNEFFLLIVEGVRQKMTKTKRAFFKLQDKRLDEALDDELERRKTYDSGFDESNHSLAISECSPGSGTRRGRVREFVRLERRRSKSKSRKSAKAQTHQAKAASKRKMTTSENGDYDCNSEGRRKAKAGERMIKAASKRALDIDLDNDVYEWGDGSSDESSDEDSEILLPLASSDTLIHAPASPSTTKEKNADDNEEAKSSNGGSEKLLLLAPADALAVASIGLPGEKENKSKTESKRSHRSKSPSRRSDLATSSEIVKTDHDDIEEQILEAFEVNQEEISNGIRKSKKTNTDLAHQSREPVERPKSPASRRKSLQRRKASLKKQQQKQNAFNYTVPLSNNEQQKQNAFNYTVPLSYDEQQKQNAFNYTVPLSNDEQQKQNAFNYTVPLSNDEQQKQNAFNYTVPLSNDEQQKQNAFNYTVPLSNDERQNRKTLNLSYPKGSDKRKQTASQHNKEEGPLSPRKKGKQRSNGMLKSPKGKKSSVRRRPASPPSSTGRRNSVSDLSNTANAKPRRRGSMPNTPATFHDAGKRNSMSNINLPLSPTSQKSTRGNRSHPISPPPSRRRISVSDSTSSPPPSRGKRGSVSNVENSLPPSRGRRASVSNVATSPPRRRRNSVSSTTTSITTPKAGKRRFVPVAPSSAPVHTGRRGSLSNGKGKTRKIKIEDFKQATPSTEKKVKKSNPLFKKAEDKKQKTILSEETKGVLAKLLRPSFRRKQDQTPASQKIARKEKSGRLEKSSSFQSASGLSAASASSKSSRKEKRGPFNKTASFESASRLSGLGALQFKTKKSLSFSSSDHGSAPKSPANKNGKLAKRRGSLPTNLEKRRSNPNLMNRNQSFSSNSSHTQSSKKKTLPRRGRQEAL